ncbi:ATP synthase [Kosakonia radicincitans UMEnt01/12]|uniref:ParB family protein n=1 Tax=Kosakonia radicincitans TaxID=283686 RepID=UPI0004613DBB|nr:ParB family protein [Kosakonia radicincitans]KDE34238.1 ATP synthase [Kosakonia radicincitans UMEnt01/12]
MSNIRDLGAAMLQRGKLPVHPASGAPASVLPAHEVAMVLTLDQLRPNPDNPRTSRNPIYDEIKASIKARGMDAIPKVTRNPDYPDVFIFSDGGNTRYQILCELWQETGDERFYRINTIFKPWPGRLKCVIGHLAEGELHGDLSYIEKAFGVHNARTIQEQELGRSVSLRELSDLLNQEGYPIDYSSISRMEDTIRYLWPCMPELLKSGLPRLQVLQLLKIRSMAEKNWSKFEAGAVVSESFESVFQSTGSHFDDKEMYSFDLFRDEFIGQLLKAFSHPSLNYDRWLIELDPKEQKRRELEGEPPPTPFLTPVTERSAGSNAKDKPQEPNPTKVPPEDNPVQPGAGLRSGTLMTPSRPEPAPEPEADLSLPVTNGVNAGSTTRREIQPDMYDGEWVISGDSGKADSSAVTLESAFHEKTDNDEPVSSVVFAATGLEPVQDIWHIPALQDDIEHLQDIAYRLVFEIAEAMDCVDSVSEDKSPNSAGFLVSENGREFSLFLAGLSGQMPNRQFNNFMFCMNFIGSHSIADTPVFDDIHVVKAMRLIRVIRRLRELQRDAARGGDNV